MNFEMRLKLLKKNWLEIQELREDIGQMQMERADLQEKLRSICQKIPEYYKELDQKLEEYNKRMV